jgi:ribosomal protein S18 acetylase RimI-like enzyme
MTPEASAAHRAIVAATRHPTQFGSVRDGGTIVAVAAAVLQGRFVYVNSVATEPALRRRGLARAVMAALLGWARRGGAAYAYLPVVKTNVAGLALYGALGFDTEAYRYHYRARPA